MRTYAVTHSVDLKRHIKEKQMGRPLHKKFFGNRNANTAVAGDDGLGGKQVASVTLGTLGSYTTRPTVTFSAPDLAGPGGVTATGTVTSEILSVVFSGTMTGYEAQDEIYFGDAVITVNIGGVDGGAITAATVTTRGSFTTLASGAQATSTNGDGEGALITVTYRAKAVVVTNPGSGYTDATDAAATFTQSVTGTTVLTTTNEKAIAAYAFVTGGSNKLADIIKQDSSTKYKVETADGIMVCKLVTDGVADAAGEMTITATDSEGGTYFVKKLTARKAVLVRNTGTQFATGASVKWTFGTAVEDAVVTIANN
jgi:hypothetical protein